MWQCSYYASGDFRSERGCHCALAISAELGEVILNENPDPVDGKAYSILRETRMAAVVCSLSDGSADHLAEVLARSSEVADAIGAGIRRSFEEAAGANVPAD